MPVRGCGASRIAGGVYVVVPHSPLGLPLESFLIDPPRRFTRDELRVMGIKATGMSLIPDATATTGWSVADWVGSEFYPNTYDILAEIRAYGLSRRVQSTLNFGLLGKGSRIYLLHERAHIDGPGREALWEGRQSSLCPKYLYEHMSWAAGENPMCVTLYRECIEGGEAWTMAEKSGVMALATMFDAENERLVRRQIGDVSYAGKRPPDGVTLTYTPAFFASFPIAGLEVVRDPIGKIHEKTAAKARKARLSVEEVDE